MKIAYVVGGLWSQHPGLHAKILGAAKVWNKEGVDVVIILFSEGVVLSSDGEVMSKINSDNRLSDFYDVNKSKFYRFYSLKYQYEFLAKKLNEIKPDVVYARYALPYPGMKNVYGAASKYVLEINSDDLVEYTLKNKITGRYNKWFRKGFISGASGICFISEELSKLNSFSWYNGKKTVIANSIDCSLFDFKSGLCNKSVNVCFIGSPNQSWHGLDKLHQLACTFNDWNFHLIGPTKSEYFAINCSLPANMNFHGYLQGDQARQVVASMDVGVSTLSLHRKQMNEASPLKSRQYLAQGVPFISGYEDTDVPQCNFVCQLPNCQSNIMDNLDRIQEFVLNAFRNERLRADARHFAEAELDVGIIERKRLEFITSCL